MSQAEPRVEGTRKMSTTPSTLHRFEVLKVTNVSTGTTEHVGHVTAVDHEQARDIACRQEIIRTFETFRVVAYKHHLHDSRSASMNGTPFPHWCDYDGPQWLGSVTCAHCGGYLAAYADCATANGTDEVAAAHADPVALVRRAADALTDLASLVESGSARLTAYPSLLPSLDDLAAAVYEIETARTFSHDQLAAFGRIAGDAADGFFVDGNGAVAAISLATAPNGLAVVTVDGVQVAHIDTGGEVSYLAEKVTR